MRKHRAASYELDGTLVGRGADGGGAQRSWDEAVALGDEHGYRNAQATVLAPTGTISFLMDCDTTGIEPDFSLVKFKELVGGGHMTIVNQTVPLALDDARLLGAEIEQIEAYINEHGTIVGAPGLKDEHLPVFDVAVGERAISHMGHIKMMARGSAVHLGRDLEDGEHAERGHGRGHRRRVHPGLEARPEGAGDLPRRLQDRAGAAHRRARRTSRSSRPPRRRPRAPTPKPVRRRMPRERQSITHKFSIGGHEGYITAGMYEDGTVGEIFLTDIGKEGSTLEGMMNAFATSMSIGAPVRRAARDVRARSSPTCASSRRATPATRRSRSRSRCPTTSCAGWRPASATPTCTSRWGS